MLLRILFKRFKYRRYKNDIFLYVLVLDHLWTSLPTVVAENALGHLKTGYWVH